MNRRGFLLTGAALLGAAVVGCGSEAESADGPRVLTAEQAQRLAVARFNNYNTGTRSVSAALTDGQLQVDLTGWVDWTDHIGYALAVPTSLQGTIDPGGPFLTRWTLAEVGQAPATGATPPLPVPATGWDTTGLNPADSFLASGLAILLNLGADRPENPQLLVQSSARWLRRDTVGGIEVDVMTGPSAADGTDGDSLRWWVDPDGLLQRLEVRFGASEHWSVMTFGAAEGVELTGSAG